MVNFVNKKYQVITYGCQMNVHDSEKISGILETMGMSKTDDLKLCDVIVFNTCCIREGAEDRAYNNIMALRELKKEKPDLIIVVCGCMPQQKEGKYDFKKKLPFVDIVIGTYNIGMLKSYLTKFDIEHRKIYEVFDKPISNVEVLKTVRDDDKNAYVNIIYGCNKFCTYCIVPYVRGRERSRDLDEIVQEVKCLVDKGYKYITLLGQNVNSYGKDLQPKTSFASLLNTLCKIEGDFKIKFMTSHPIDFNKEIIKVMAKQPKIAKSLHLPVQSGSNTILKAMNRRYTVGHYLKLINFAKKKIKNISLSTDIIVGFPGETDKDFQDTLKLIKKVKYDQVFAFMYSKRTGTPAAEFENQIEEKVKKKRLNTLLRTQKFIQTDNITKCFGKVYNALIRTDSGVTVGFTDGGREVYLPSDNVTDEIENTFQNIRVETIRNHKLSGSIIKGKK